MIQLFIFIIFAAHIGLPAEVLTTFEELQTRKPLEEISIRGFPYLGKDGVIYLSAEPNLKSCCVGASAKASTQVVLEGISELDMKPGHVVTVSGNLFSVSADEKTRYILKNGKIVSNSSSYQALGLVGGVLAACVLLILFRLKN